MNNKIKGSLFLITGLIPYVIVLIILINSMIRGTSDCIVDLGPETNCNTIYGFAAFKYVSSILYALCYLYWFIAVPMIFLTVSFIIRGIKIIRGKKK